MNSFAGKQRMELFVVALFARGRPVGTIEELFMTKILHENNRAEKTASKIVLDCEK